VKARSAGRLRAGNTRTALDSNCPAKSATYSSNQAYLVVSGRVNVSMLAGKS
jgi:hypothetical protein